MLQSSWERRFVLRMIASCEELMVYLVEHAPKLRRTVFLLHAADGQYRKQPRRMECDLPEARSD